MLLNTVKSTITGGLILLSSSSIFAQLPVDGFYPKKNTVVAALSYDYKSYDDFYVGSSLAGGTPGGLIRTDLPVSAEGSDPIVGNLDDASNQQSLGEITSTIISIYAQYGITDRLSITATLPYISVTSEDDINDPAQLSSTVDGLQDIGFFVKGLISEKTFKDSSKFSLGGAIGITFPIGDYEGGGVLSLGNEATSYQAETILHYETTFGVFVEGKFGSSVNSSDEFDIPPALFYSAKVGYIHKYFYVHSELDIQNSVSGLDIGGEGFTGVGDLPETEVDFTRLLFNVYVPFYKNTLGVSANYLTTLDGRNVNDDSSFGAGLVYNFN